MRSGKRALLLLVSVPMNWRPTSVEDIPPARSLAWCHFDGEPDEPIRRPLCRAVDLARTINHLGVIQARQGKPVEEWALVVYRLKPRVAKPAVVKGGAA